MSDYCEPKFLSVFCIQSFWKQVQCAV